MKNYEIIGPCIYLKKEKILVVGDVHCGFEKEMRRFFGSIFIGQKKENLRLMRKVLEKVQEIKKVVFLGDITHSFSYKRKEIEEFDELLSILKEKNKEIEVFIVRGNHDIFLKEEMFTNKVKISDFFIFENCLFVHGHKNFFEKNKNEIKKSKRIFIGHFHPAIELKDDVKKEKFKCFLIGKYKGKEFFFLPSFFPFIEGSDIRKNKEINQDLIKKLNVFVIDDNFGVYGFRRLEKID